MGGHYIRARAHSAGLAWRAGVFTLALLPISVLFFRLQLLDLPALSWALLLAGGIGALALVLSLYSVAVVWHKGARGGGRATASLFVACLAALPFAGAAYLFTTYPEGGAAQTTGFAAAGSEGEADDNEMTTDRAVLPGRDFQATASMVYEAARTALDDRGMTIVDAQSSAEPSVESGDLGVTGTVLVPFPTSRDTIDPAEEYDRFALKDAREYTIQATAYAPIFAFPSDLTIRITEDGAQTFVDVRSVSRSLDRDFGQNRRFIDGFLSSLDDAMKAAEGVTPEE